MKTSVNLFLALTIASQLVLLAPTAQAKKKDPAENAWISHNAIDQVFNFRMSNGDVLIVKQNQYFGGKASVQVRPHGEDGTMGSTVEALSNIRQFGGPSQVFDGAKDTITDNYHPVHLANAPSQVNLFYVRGENGLLVIGQINQVKPVRYFTHLIPSDVVNEIPVAQMSYALPSTGIHHQLDDAIDIGLVLGFADGRTVTRLLQVPKFLHAPPVPVKEQREIKDADAPYLRIKFEHGRFVIPQELAQSIAASTSMAAGPNLTGVDLYRANSARSDALMTALKAKIFGQDEALRRIVFQYLQTLATPMTKPKVLVLMGPSGVGKTFVGQQIARELYGSDERFLEIPGNEFNAHAGSLESSKIFGSPASVSNAIEGSLITWLKALKGRPGLLLINEGDKMHPDVWMKFMELLDQGKVTAGDGTVLEAKNIIILITTNRGATQMFPSSIKDWSQADIDKRLAGLDKNTLKGYYLQKQGLRDERTLPREVINRVAEYIPFGPFSRQAAVQIAHAAVTSLVEDYQKEYQVVMDLDEASIEQIALGGWTPSDDARQVREQVAATVLQAFDTAVHKLQVQNGQVVQVTYDRSDIRHPVFRVTVGENSTTIPAPQALSNNPLKNQELKQVLLTLEKKMKAQVIGQDGTIKNIVSGVISHAMRTEKNRPLVIGLIGVSGNGKTETARALANARYGGHIEIMSMGEITTISDFEKKFGGPASHQGGDIAREFEEALKKHPDGGVIVFDEISNMGGGDPAMRAALLMKLYGIFEEGVFVSPVDGKTYNLEKYVFVLTGNESEKLFANLSSDDMLKTTWEDNRSPEKVRQQLNDAKYPQAFVNRVKWYLMKPLLSNEVHTVTKKLWDREADAFMRENVGAKVTTGTNFFDRVSMAYFSPDKGGRAVRDVFEDKIGELIFFALHGSEIDTEDLRGVEIRVDLLDNRLTTPYVTAGTPPRSVAFQATIIKDGHEIHSFAIDATDLAAEQILLGRDAALAVSYHEMGHGSFEGLTPQMLKQLGYSADRISEITGMQLKYVTIRGGRAGDIRYYGYARSAPIEGAMLNPTHDRAVIHMAELWAGSIAQQMAGFPKDAGWSNDLEKIRKIATSYFTKWGLDPDFVGLPVTEKGEPMVPPELSALYQKRYNALVKEAEKLAIRVVRMRWDFIGTGANELMTHGEVSIDRLHEIDAHVTAMHAAGKKVPVERELPPIRTLRLTPRGTIVAPAAEAPAGVIAPAAHPMPRIHTGLGVSVQNLTASVNAKAARGSLSAPMTCRAIFQ